ncbi:hypothetical protein VUR80DRAFT_4940 [Thermomyces stellatus]
MAAHYAIDQPKGEQVVKKLEMVIRPLMGLVYFFQGLDKQCINYASLVGEYSAAYLMSCLSVVRLIEICV